MYLFRDDKKKENDAIPHRNRFQDSHDSFQISQLHIFSMWIESRTHSASCELVVGSSDADDG